LLIISMVVGVFCLAKLNSNKKENQTLAAEVKDRQGEIDRLKGEGEKVQQALSPEQKAVLTAAHKLVDNKKFGWSKLFADLESVLPGSVSTSRIAVQNVFEDGGRIKAELELGVISRDYSAIMAMIDNMNNSGMFQAELPGQDLQKNERMTYTEYTFRIIYSQGYGTPPTLPPNAVAQNGSGGAQ